LKKGKIKLPRDFNKLLIFDGRIKYFAI